jgi:hypothetical protein
MIGKVESAIAMLLLPTNNTSSALLMYRAAPCARLSHEVLRNRHPKQLCSTLQFLPVSLLTIKVVLMYLCFINLKLVMFLGIKKKTIIFCLRKAVRWINHSATTETIAPNIARPSTHDIAYIPTTCSRPIFGSLFFSVLVLPRMFGFKLWARFPLSKLLLSFSFAMERCSN